MSKILLVDDDADLRDLWTLALTTHGHDVMVAADGDVALGAYGQQHPDLVITDLDLPHVHGLALIAKLRAIHPDVTIVAVSGHERQLRLARPLGASVALQKPVRIADLIVMARRAPRDDHQDT